MNYERPELLEPLAAAYVLGVLRHRARRRFESLCLHMSGARAARQRWEDRLLPLALALPPVAPSAEVWTRIRERIAQPRRRGLRWWQMAAAASLIGVLLLVGRLTIWSPPAWQNVALLAQANAAPLWRVERTADYARISIRTLGTVSLDSTRSYELWILPGGGHNPVSLGLLPRSGQLARALTPAQRALLTAAAQVAVSIEPAGGSPTGLPTGPVVIVAPIVRAT